MAARLGSQWPPRGPLTTAYTVTHPSGLECYLSDRSFTTVYLIFFLSLSGLYLWTALRSERRVGLILLASGALTFWGMVYAVVY